MLSNLVLLQISYNDFKTVTFEKKRNGEKRETEAKPLSPFTNTERGELNERRIHV